MSAIIPAVIAIVLGVIVAWATRNVERRPPTWIVGLTIAVAVFPIAYLGGSVAFSATEDGIPGEVSKRLFVADAETGESRVLLGKRGYYEECAWSPDGSTIALTGHGFEDRRLGMLLVDADTGDSSFISVEDGSPNEIVWSAGGGRMAWWQTEFEMQGFVPGDMSRHLIVADADGGNRRELVTLGDVGVDAFLWSPDDGTLAYNSWDTRGIITLVDAEDGSTRPLPVSGGSIYDFDWSPEGKEIAIIGYGPSGSGVYVIATDGSGTRHITTWSGMEVAWSPQGDFVASADDGRRATEVYITAPDGTEQKHLSSLPAASSGGLVWSPDGTKLALWAYLDERPEIVVIDVSSGRWRSVATIQSEDAVARPSPMGGPFGFLDRVMRRFSRSPGGTAPAPDMTFYERASFSWGADSRQIAYVSGDPGDEPSPIMGSFLDLPLMLLFALAAPVALVGSIWAWTRHGTSVLTVLCTLATILPSLGCLAIVVMFLFGLMMAASFMFR